MIATTDERATHRRWNRIYSAIAAIVVVMAVLPSVQVARWIGRPHRTVIVTVVDVRSSAAISGARVTIFHGPVELYPFSPRPSPDPRDPSTQTVGTNSEGRAEMNCQFTASGSTSLLAETGSVRFGDRWIEVSADGYETLLIRMGDQIGESRDIHDESPVFVKLELRKKEQKTEKEH